MNFKKARLAAGLTLDEAAKKLGYDHTAIVGWEKASGCQEQQNCRKLRKSTAAPWMSC